MIMTDAEVFRHVDQEWGGGNNLKYLFTKKPKKIFLLQWSMGRLHRTRPRQTKRIVAWNYVLYAGAVCPIYKVRPGNMWPMQKPRHNKICHFNLVSAQSLNIPGLLFGRGSRAGMAWSVWWQHGVSSQWVHGQSQHCLTWLQRSLLLISTQHMDHHFHLQTCLQNTLSHNKEMDMINEWL